MYQETRYSMGYGAMCSVILYFVLFIFCGLVFQVPVPFGAVASGFKDIGPIIVSSIFYFIMGGEVITIAVGMIVGALFNRLTEPRFAIWLIPAGVVVAYILLPAALIFAEPIRQMWNRYTKPYTRWPICYEIVTLDRTIDKSDYIGYGKVTDIKSGEREPGYSRKSKLVRVDMIETWKGTLPQQITFKYNPCPYPQYPEVKEEESVVLFLRGNQKGEIVLFRYTDCAYIRLIDNQYYVHTFFRTPPGMTEYTFPEMAGPKFDDLRVYIQVYQDLRQ